MSQETFILAYQEGDSRVTDFAIARAQKEQAALHVVHVLEWSPYSFLTPEEVEERHSRRKAELARAESLVLDPVLKTIGDAGIPVSGDIRYGKAANIIIEIAKEKAASMIFTGRCGGASLSSRMLGSVSIVLAQSAPIPTVIIP